MDLKTYLFIKNMTAKEFARICGVSFQVVQGIKERKKHATYNVAKKISHATDGMITIESVMLNSYKRSREEIINMLIAFCKSES